MNRGEDATVVFVPTVRRPPPPVETADIEVSAPPQPPQCARLPSSSWLVPLVMATAMTGMTTVFYRSAENHSPIFLAVPAMMLVSACATAVFGRHGSGANLDADRRDYLQYLSALRVRVAEIAEAQRNTHSWDHPDPTSLWSLVGDQRMWERREADPDFAEVRVGVGTRQLATRLIAPPAAPPGRTDFVTETAMQRFIDTYSSVPDLPAVLGLCAAAVVSIDGDADPVRGLLRAMICQLAVWHRPDELLIAAVIGEHRLNDWDWLKWLPHHQHPLTTDAVGPARLRYPDLAGAGAAIAELSADRVARHRQPCAVIVVLDDDGRNEPRRSLPGATVVDVGGDGDGVVAEAGVRLRVRDETLTLRGGGNGGDDICARPDFLNLAEARMCARRLAGYRLGTSDQTGCGASWAQQVGIGDPAEFDPTKAWPNGDHRDRLRVPIGTTISGAAAEIDIKEAAENGMGPHGLCVGATGSGKSELLRVIALGMLTRHSPEELNLVLIDFKGGATFLGLEQARHVAAIITNLADEAPLVARMHDALAGEMTRRQKLLRGAGNVSSAAAYQRARRAGAPWRPLPSLFIVVDEFSELLSQHPDFVDIFVAIGRLGRSLGMHLLLASQRLDEGRLRGLDAHLSYRICLKTLSVTESRIVLGVPDAYELPNTPGAGYLRQATGETIRFQSAFVSGPCPRRPTTTAVGPGAETSPVRVFTAAPGGAVHRDDPAETAGGETTLQTVLDRLAGHGPPAHRVWLPPLGAAPILAALLGDGTADAELTVPVGLVDRPFEQQRTPMLVDLSGAAGNAAVVGGPRSGKSTALCTLITSLAATHDPEQVQIYCIDLGGGTLESVRTVPHVGSVAGRADRELIARTVAELEGIVARREARTDNGFGEVFLVIDGWAGLRHDFAELEESITALAAGGLSFGVHVVVSATRWAEIRPALKDQIGTRIELRLGDPADSEIDRRRAHQVPAGSPGRGLTQDGLHMLLAVPLLAAAAPGSATVHDGARTGALLRRRYGDRAAAPIRLLPTHVDHRAVVEAAAGAGPPSRVLIGVDESQIQPVGIDFARQPHLLVFGDAACGKTSVLRALCREITRTATAKRAQLVIVDYRRCLLGVVGSEHLGGYAPSPAALGAVLPELLEQLRARMPGSQVTAEQLRARSWWSGPEVYLLVDDYDLVAAATGNPLAPIGDLLPHAADIGLHVVVARRTGGAARALFEPLLAGLRDQGCMGLMMSGNPDDGTLLGSVRPVPLPPGRATLITRGRGEQRIQVCWSPP